MASARKSKRGRPRTPQKRLGKHQAKLFKALVRAIKRFRVHDSDARARETTLNTRLIKKLRHVDSRIVNRDIESVGFVGETYRPECSLTDHGVHPLFALECK